MRKKMKLLGMMLGLLLLPTGILAQSWTASAPAEGGTYFLYNVGKQAFMCGANNYGTRISAIPGTVQNGIPVTLEASGVANRYFVSTSPTYNGLYMGNDMYVDKAKTDQYAEHPWEFSLVSGTTDTYYIKETRKNRWLTIRSTDTKCELAQSEPTNNTLAHWKLLTRENYIQYLADNATKENPLDATMLLMNPNFGKNSNASLWNNPSIGGNESYCCAEFWNTTFNASQTLTNIPNGVYEMNIQGYYRVGDGTNDASAAAAARTNGNEVLNAAYFINDQEKPLMSIFDNDLCLSNNGTYNTSVAVQVNGVNYYVPNNMSRASECFHAGKYQNEPIRVVVTDGTITLGIKKTVSNSQDWTIFDNITLTYYGIDMEEMIEQSVSTWHNKYDAIVNQATDHSAYDQVIADAANCHSMEELEAYDATVWNAVCDILQNGTTTTGLPFDITSLIVNPNFDNNDSYGWTAEGTTPRFKSGVGDLYNVTNATLTQTLPSMPAGNYTLKVQAFYRSTGENDAAVLYKCGIDEVRGSLILGDQSQLLCNMYDQARYQPAMMENSYGGANQKITPNSKTACGPAFEIGQYWNILNATTTTAGDLTIGLKIQYGLSGDWLVYDNFRLYYGDFSVPVDLTAGMPTEDTDATTVTTGITLNSGEYNKVCLPFNLNAVQTALAFTNVYTLAGVNEGVGQLVQAYTIEAGKAYYVTVDAQKELTVNNVRVCVAKPDSIPVMWEGAATVGHFNDFSFDVNPSPGVTISSYAPVDYQNMNFTVNQENWYARRFLNEFTYDEDMSSKIDYYNAGRPIPLDQPHSVFIPVPKRNSELTVTVSKNSDYSEAETFTFPAGTTLCELPNLIPQNTYYYKVVGEGVLTKGQFQTEGHLRMIKANSGFNIRDLGGWMTESGDRMNYGKIFRGGEINFGHVVSYEDLAELRRIGCGAELDWRRNDECEGEEPTMSVLTLDSEHYLYFNHDYANMSIGYDVNQDHYRRAFNFTLDNLRDGRAVYFHCRIGADRTGMYALLIEGLCGMTYDQLAKDYELTSYSSDGSTGTRKKSSGDFSSNFNYINALPGNTLQQKFFYYWHNEIGIETRDLLDFIDIMVGNRGSLEDSDLSFMNANDEYHQNSSDIIAICSNGSEIVNGSKALLTTVDGDENDPLEEVNMNIDAMFITFDPFTTTLEPNSVYKLIIPMGSISKSGSTNAAPATLIFHTPLVFDGDYYIYWEEIDQFLGHGRNYGTRGVLDNFGIPATFTTDVNNITTVKFMDNNLYWGDQDGYLDKGTGDPHRWTIEPANNYANDGSLLFFLNDNVNKYITMSYNSSDKCWFNRLRTAEEAEPTPLQVKTLAEYNEIIARKKQTNILAAATAAGITANDLSELETALSNYTVTPLTGVIKSADVGNSSDWVFAESYTRDDYNSYNIGDYGAELYQKFGTVSQTVTVPHAGFYKLTLNAFMRQGSNSLCYAAGEKGFVLSDAWVSINDTYYAQVPDWYSNCLSNNSPNDTETFKSITDGDPTKYFMEVYAYIDDSKTAKITLTVPGFTPSEWCIFNHWVLSEYVPNVTISETDEEPAEAKDLANVTLVRTLKPDILNTFSVPFNLSADQIAASPLANATIYQYGSSTVNVINYEQTTAIEAGKPYIVKLAEGSEDLVNPVFNNVSVISTAGLTVGDESAIRFVGQPYYNKGITENYPYVFYINTSGESKKLSQTGSIKGLRAYYLLPSTNNDGNVKAYFNDIASSIDEILGEGIDGVKAIYDLSGRKIDEDAPLVPGIYIINGKKVMVK